jgi:hypothetical protein
MNTTTNTYTLDLNNPTTLNKVTDSILLVLNLPYQAALPLLLNQPDTQNNREAVQAWLNDFLKESDWIEPNDLVQVCTNRLKRLLLDWQECA